MRICPICDRETATRKGKQCDVCGGSVQSLTKAFYDPQPTSLLSHISAHDEGSVKNWFVKAESGQIMRII